MGHEVENMAYSVDAQGRGVPWHKLGKAGGGNGNGMTMSEAMALAPETAATVEAWTLEAVSADGKTRIPIDDAQPVGAYVANVREPVVTDEGVKPHTVVGVVTDSYELAQTREQYAAVERLVGEAGLMVETAISLAGGRRHVLLLRLPDNVVVVGDVMVPFLAVLNAFDGTRGLTFATTMIRIVCANTERLALHDGRTRLFTLPHRTGLNEKLEEARRALGFSQAWIEGLNEYAELLAGHKLGRGDLNRLLVETFPMPERAPNEEQPVFHRRELRTREAQLQVRELVRTADNLTEHRGTAWGYLQGVIEWEDHVANAMREHKDASVMRARAERRMERLVLSDTPTVERAQRAIAELVPVRA